MANSLTDKIALNFYNLFKSGEHNEADLILGLRKFLDQNHLSLIFPNVLNRVKFMIDRDNQKNVFKITTVNEINHQSVLKIKKFCGIDEETKTELLIDKNIVGGFQSRIGDIFYDSSIKYFINCLRKGLISNLK